MKPISIDLSHEGVCAKCGGCCSNFLPLTKSEIKRLRKFVKKKRLKPHMRVDKLDLRCPLLDPETMKCECYDIRPEVCRLYDCHQDSLGLMPKLQGQKSFSIVNVRNAVFDIPLDLTVADYLALSSHLN